MISLDIFNGTYVLHMRSNILFITTDEKREENNILFVSITKNISLCFNNKSHEL